MCGASLSRPNETPKSTRRKRSSDTRTSVGTRRVSRIGERRHQSAIPAAETARRTAPITYGVRSVRPGSPRSVRRHTAIAPKATAQLSAPAKAAAHSSVNATQKIPTAIAASIEPTKM
jgi:hypothetical protein